jgi:hypothetical protein
MIFAFKRGGVLSISRSGWNNKYGFLPQIVRHRMKNRCATIVGASRGPKVIAASSTMSCGLNLLSWKEVVASAGLLY